MAKEKTCDPKPPFYLNTGRPVLRPKTGPPINNTVSQIRMAVRHRLGWISGGLFALLAIGFLLGSILGLPRHPIEGLWRSHYYTDCMCDSCNFWQFRDGKIVSYSDQHLTDYAAGTYEYLGLGRYKVTVTRSERPPFQWTVHPGRDSWAAPPENLKEWFFYDRRFNRVALSGREEAIIKDAPERDERFRAIIEKRKADKATKEANKANNNGVGQPATRSESDSVGGEKAQPEAEGRSR